MSDEIDHQELLRAVAAFERHVAELAQAVGILRQTLVAPDDSMIPLKVAAGRSGFSCECVRLWAVHKTVRGRKRGGRWFLDQNSLEEHLQRRYAR